MNDSRYVAFDDILATTKELYAYALHKCESGNQEDAIKLANEIRDHQEYLLNRIEQSPNLSDPVDQLLNYSDIRNACPSSELQCYPLDNNNDCNAATAGSILGAMIGLSGIDEKWYKPFNGQLSSYIAGEEHIRIDEFIKRYYEQSEKFRCSR